MKRERVDKELHLSPSVYHRQVMNQTKQALAYSGGDVKRWQRRLREKLTELVGQMPKKRVPLNVRSIWKHYDPLGTIEKIVFTSEPCADVPAYVCIPENAPRPTRL